MIRLRQNGPKGLRWVDGVNFDLRVCVEPRRTEKNREEPRRAEKNRGEPRRTKKSREERRRTEKSRERRTLTRDERLAGVCSGQSVADSAIRPVGKVYWVENMEYVRCVVGASWVRRGCGWRVDAVDDGLHVFLTFRFARLACRSAAVVLMKGDKELVGTLTVRGFLCCVCLVSVCLCRSLARSGVR